MSWIQAAIGIGTAIFQGHQAQQQGHQARKAMKDMNPFAPFRKQYAEQLGKMMEDPAGFLDNPLYHSAFDQGTQAVMRGMAANKYLGSGNMATGLQSFGMGKAQDIFMDSAKFMSHLAGADMGGSAGPLQGIEQSNDRYGDVFGQLGSIFEGLPGMGASGMGGNVLQAGPLNTPDYGPISVGGPSGGFPMPTAAPII